MSAPFVSSWLYSGFLTLRSLCDYSMGRRSARPIYIGLENFKDNVRNSPYAKTLIGLIELPARRPKDPEWRSQLIERGVFQACLRIILDQLNEYRLGFPFMLSGSTTLSILVPRVGLIVADIPEQRAMFATHAHYSRRVIAKVMPSKAATPAEDGDEAALARSFDDVEDDTILPVARVDAPQESVFSRSIVSLIFLSGCMDVITPCTLAGGQRLLLCVCRHLLYEIQPGEQVCLRSGT